MCASASGPSSSAWSRNLPFAEDLLAAYYCAFDRETPRHVQVSLLGAIAYFVLPFDFVPDVLPVLGFTDDAAVLATAIRIVSSHIRPDHHEAAQRGAEARAGQDKIKSRSGAALIGGRLIVRNMMQNKKRAGSSRAFFL